MSENPPKAIPQKSASHPKKHDSAPAQRSRETQEGKRPVGAPTKYKPEYCQKIIEFFTREHSRERVKKVTTFANGSESIEKEEVGNELPMFEGFALEIDATVESLWQWRKKHPEFAEAYKKAKYLQKQMLVGNGVRGLYGAAAFIFTAKNIIGWRDVVEQKHSGKIGVKKENADFVSKFANSSPEARQKIVDMMEFAKNNGLKRAS